MTSKARSMIEWTSSGSSRSDIAVKPETSVNITVTCLRSPSRAERLLRIFSARCLGVYACGEAKRAAGPVSAAGVGAGRGAAATAVPAARAAPHSPQNLLAGGFLAWQPGQTASRRAPHSPQNFMPAGLSCAHREHFMDTRLRE